jgi:hypothetical protein
LGAEDYCGAKGKAILLALERGLYYRRPITDEAFETQNRIFTDTGLSAPRFLLDSKLIGPSMP